MYLNCAVSLLVVAGLVLGGVCVNVSSDKEK